MEQIECDICGGENKPGAECDNFICPNYEPNRTMNDTPRTDKAIKESNGQWSYALADTCKQLERELTAMTEQRDEARRLAEKYRYLSCDSLDEADETLLPWETTNPNEL